MDSIPTDLLEIKNRLDSFRLHRSYRSEPWPQDLRQDITAIAAQYPESLVRKVLKIHPERLAGNKTSKPITKSSKAKNNSAFFDLSKIDPLQRIPSLPSDNNVQSRILIERSDGTRMTLTLQSLDAASVASLCSQFLGS